jgi:hypothetical protein
MNRWFQFGARAKVMNCPKCGQPLERGYLMADCVWVHDRRFAEALKQSIEEFQVGHGGQEYDAGRAFALFHPPGTTCLHCNFCYACKFVVACASDDASKEVDPSQFMPQSPPPIRAV